MILNGLKHIVHLLSHSIAVVAAIVALTMVSCSGDAPAVPGEEDQTGVVAFRVLTYKNQFANGLSRATWNDYYESENGNDFETALIKDQLFVVITDDACSEKYAVTRLVCTRTIETPLVVAYDYKGRIDKDDIEKVSALNNGKLHVIANSGYTAHLENNTRFSCFGTPDDDFTAIPMWGVKTFDFTSITPNTTLDVGNVTLLRSMAKVVIDNKQDDDNYIRTLKTVTISTINRQGYLLPQGWSKISDTKSLDRNAVRIPTQSASKNVVFTFSNNHIEFYMPEIRNTGNDNDEVTLTLTFDTAHGEKSGTLYFRRYENGDPEGDRYDIRRNYLYNYVVDMEMRTDLNVVVDVLPYTAVELDPDFGFITPLPSKPTGPDTPGWVEINP